MPARRRPPQGRTIPIGAGIPALAALAMMAWTTPSQAAATVGTMLIPICGGGFHPLDLPGGPSHGPACDKACHALCSRKSLNAHRR